VRGEGGHNHLVEEPDEVGVVLEVDLRHDSHLDHLPEQPEHQVRRARHDVARADVDDAAADRDRRVQREVEVLGHLEERERGDAWEHEGRGA